MIFMHDFVILLDKSYFHVSNSAFGTVQAQIRKCNCKYMTLICSNNVANDHDNKTFFELSN